MVRPTAARWKREGPSAAGGGGEAAGSAGFAFLAGRLRAMRRSSSLSVASVSFLPAAAYVVWPMADDVARGGTGLLRQEA
eukprot:469347-Prymnesium_polylepis.2